MEAIDFEKLKNRFILEDVDSKVDIYISTEGLTSEQYKELLRVFPLESLSILERALS